MLHFRCAGAGAPLLLLHGLFGSLENLGAVARFLSEKFRVYSVDLPNHGRSAHCSGVDLADMAKHVERWMEQEGLQRAHVVGHSLGGKVAMELALSEPDRVERMVIIDIAPVGYPSRHDNVFAGLHAINLERLTSRSDADAALAEYVDEAPVRSFLLKNLIKAERGFAWRMNLADLTASYPKLIAANRTGTFARPVLFLKGEHSNYITPSAKAETVQRFPNAELREVGDTAHWLHAEKPELVSKLLIKFLAG